MNDNLRISLRLLVYQEGGHWFGHCLEFDIVEAGATPEEAIANVVQLCQSQIERAYEDGDLQSVFRPAPAEYWRQFSLARDMDLSQTPPRPIDRIEARELAFA